MLEKPFKRLRGPDGKLIRDRYGRYKYALSFRVGGRGSRKINRRMFFKDDQEASAEVARLRGIASAVSDKYTWSEAYDLFCKGKPGNSDDYRKSVKTAVDYIRKRCGERIEKTTLSAFAEALRDKAEKTSARRANNIRAYVLSVARFARGEGMVSGLPFDHVPARQEKRCGRIPFPFDEFRAYYSALDMFARPLFLALAAAGERVTAMCNLNMRDVFQDQGKIIVTKKGGKRREIPLTKALGKALEAAFGAASSVMVMLKDKEAVPVFVNRRGMRWTRFTFRQNCHRAWERAGLTEFPIHTLRNMVASEMADANSSRDTISAMLGHDDTSTADIYVKAREKMKAATAGLTTWSDQLEKALGKRLWGTDEAPAPKKGTKSAGQRDKQKPRKNG